MEITARLQLSSKQKLFFSAIEYHQNVIGHHGARALSEFKNNAFTLVTGIAKPEPLINYLNAEGLSYTHLEYPDHHNFTDKEIKYLNSCGLILTTEKDYTRLSEHVEQLYYLPIGVKILDREKMFNTAILEAIKG